MPKHPTHLFPFLGKVEIQLFGVAPELYEFLIKRGEHQRLFRLNHLGAASKALTGMRHTRWDYSLSMLYFASKLKFRGSRLPLIGGYRFTSMAEALQVMALVWNLGHFPGTYSTEKGIYRYLCLQDKKEPFSCFDWGKWGLEQDEKKILLRSINLLSQRIDYRSVSRVFLIRKLLLLSRKSELIQSLLWPFFLPLIIDGRLVDSEVDRKFRSAWSLVRHFGYLTLDYPYTGLGFGMNIPELFKRSVGVDVNLERVVDSLSSLLSQVERSVFETLYFSDMAKKESALHAHRVHLFLEKSNNAIHDIERWATIGRMYDMRLGKMNTDDVVSFPVK